MTQRALIIDGNSIINRAFFGIKGMATPDGFPTNAVYGFLSIFQSIQAEIKPDYIAVAFDLKGPTFRHLDFVDYKAGRKGMPDELAQQMPVVKEILRAMGIVILELQGFEADDLIGTTARFFATKDVDSFILTGDKDALQLVDQKTYVYYHGTKNKTIYTPELVKEDLGVYPDRVTDLKGLMGDSSDNIPGVPSIGKVTANKLLEVFDTVENLIANASQITNARQKDLIETHAAQAVMSKRLATIETQVPVDFDMAELALTPQDTEQLVTLFQKYHLHSFLQKLDQGEQKVIEQVAAHSLSFPIVTNMGEVTAFLTEAVLSKPLVFQALYQKKTVVQDPILYLGLLTTPDSQTDEKTSQAITNNLGLLIPPAFIFEAINCLKAHGDKGGSLAIKGHDIKNAVLALKGYGLEQVHPVFDSKIAMYLLDANRKSYDLGDLTLDVLGLAVTSEDDLLGKGAKRKELETIEEDAVLAYLGQMLEAHLALEPILLERMAALEVQNLFDTVEMPLVRVLAHMEYDGFKVDLDVLETIDVSVTEAITKLEASIYEAAGQTFNINSPKQLGTILFEELALPTDKKTKTGYSTGHEVLVKLAPLHPIVDQIIEYRMYTKIKSTYIDGLRAVLNPITGRVHSSLNQTVAATGRLSSTEPNLQNIPIRLAIGRELRKVFVAKDDDHKLVDADYSQIELRILAHMSNDPMLKKAYTEDIDIHALTASQVFHVPLSEMTPQIRNSAKEVNFGIVYGMSDFGLADTLKITRKEAKHYIESYFASYPNVKSFMNSCKDDAAATGYSETLLGRKRFIPEIKNKNFNIRQYGERMAMNTPIQGTAADIMKVAMIKVFDALETAGLKSRLILQVHDEVIVDTHKDEVEAVMALVEKAMTSAIELTVPLKVDAHVGHSWFDAK